MNFVTEGSATSAVTASGKNEMLFMGFNQDYGCFAVGTTDGFIIYNVDPFKETFRRIFPSGGIGKVEMLFRCNLLALVGGGKSPRYPTNKVMIWDDHQNKCIGELKFRTEVFAVRLRRDRVVVVLESKVFVYRFKDLKLMDQITTVSNPKGLVSLCSEVKNNVLAIPGLQRGLIRIELYDMSKATLIKAHDAELSQFALNSDGSRIASASEKGTLIRIWNCHNGDPLRELRRGMDRAEIYSIAFNPTSSFVACSSDKGTIHIYSLNTTTTTTPSHVPNSSNSIRSDDDDGNHNHAHNPTLANKHADSSFTASSSAAAAAASSSTHTSFNASANNASVYNHSSNNTGTSSSSSIPPSPSSSYPSSSSSSSPSYAVDQQQHPTNSSHKLMSKMSFLKGILPIGIKYFESEWSFAQLRGIEGRSVCAFSKDSHRIVVITSEGSFIVAGFEDGGDCQRISTARFLKSNDEIQSDLAEHDSSWRQAGFVSDAN